MARELFEVQLAKPERQYVKVYKDFLKSGLIDAEEKLVYIALKSFITYGHDEGEAYPSMETLCELTSMSKPRATKAIKGLMAKGIVTKTRRGLNKTNLYMLYDNPAIWQAESIEELKKATENRLPYSSEELIEELIRRGELPEVQAQKKSSTVGAGDDGDNQVTYSFDNSNVATIQSQERFSHEEIKTLLNYEAMIKDKRVDETDVEAVFLILYDTVNTTKQTIKIWGEDKPTMVVVGKLMRLNYDEIEYAIRKYNEVTERIANPKAYMLSILYGAKEQKALDTTNQYQHNKHMG